MANKNPHAVPFHQKQRNKESGHKGEVKNNILERDSPRPFGRFTTKRKFIYSTKNIPLYNVPSLEGFEVKNQNNYLQLKPYVSYATPKI